METVDVTVIGAGLAGSVAALALARRGRKVTLVAGDTRPKDRRTTALMDQSIRFLDRLGLWEELKSQGEALSTMQIIDGTKRLLRAPPSRFAVLKSGWPPSAIIFKTAIFSMCSMLPWHANPTLPFCINRLRPLISPRTMLA